MEHEKHAAAGPEDVVLKITAQANVIRYSIPQPGKAFMMRESKKNIAWFPHSISTVTTTGEDHNLEYNITMPLWLANKNKPFLDELIQQGRITVIQWPK